MKRHIFQNLYILGNFGVNFAKFLNEEQCRQGVLVVCRSYSMSKFKLILFDKEGGVRCIEESGPVRVPGFYEKNETKQFYSKLGESCEWSDNCFAAYAICKMGKCACDGAFDEKDGICRPKTVYCPDPEGGDAKAISTPKFCHVEYSNTTISNIGCSSEEFCFAHPISRSSPKNFFPSGHCCPLLSAKTKLSAP
uniref:EB domain-containing protein n=1 Tax=Romanomermis culicivorax TaxID=13658 RepID=A0A915HTY3_ROMCU